MVAEIGDWTTGEIKRWCMFCHSELEEDPNPPEGPAPIGRFYIHKTTGNHGCASATNPALPEESE